jgi:hypothetical protein
MLKGAQPRPAAVKLSAAAVAPVLAQPPESRLNSESAKPPAAPRTNAKAVFPSVEEPPTSHALPAAETLSEEKGAPPVAVQEAAAPLEFRRKITNEVEGCVVTATNELRRRRSAARKLMVRDAFDQRNAKKARWGDVCVAQL